MQSRLVDLVAQLEQRLLWGEHLTLYGPRGGGKSSVLTRLLTRFQRDEVPCAYSSATDSLDDITRALERAYPGVETWAVRRRTARGRLWHAADRRAGVLLLDHFRCSGTGMVSFLRHLHGKIAGVLTAIDVDTEVERRRMRPWRYGALSVRMPSATHRQLRRLLDDQWSAAHLPALTADARDACVAAAYGRPGWIVKCTELAREQRYWCIYGPMITVLCVDTEAAVRYRALAMVRAELSAPCAGRRAEQGSSMPGREAATSPVAKRLTSVTWRDPMAPAKIRPPGGQR